MKFLALVATLFGAVGLMALRQEGLGFSAVAIATLTLMCGLLLAAGLAGLVTSQLRTALELD
jgi:hypothetical protein